VALAVAIIDRHATVIDRDIFTVPGHLLLSSRWASTFADPAVQAGPIQLLLFGLTGPVRPSAAASTALLTIVVECGVVAGSMAVAGMLLRGRPGERVLLMAVGLVVALSGIIHSTLVSGHPADAAIPLMWIAAACQARRGRTVVAGMLLGLSAGWEVWGVLGAPVAFLASGRRETARILGVQALVFLVMFGPFLLAGRFNMFRYQWHVSANSPLLLFLRRGSTFPWIGRLAQGAAAAAAGWAVARRRPSLRGRAWQVAGVIVLVRLLLDPVEFLYYWIAPQIITVIAVAEVVGFALAKRTSAQARPVDLAACRAPRSANASLSSSRSENIPVSGPPR
jgi:hypothetical protein